MPSRFRYGTSGAASSRVKPAWNCKRAVASNGGAARAEGGPKRLAVAPAPLPLHVRPLGGGEERQGFAPIDVAAAPPAEHGGEVVRGGHRRGLARPPGGQAEGAVLLLLEPQH